MVAGKIEVVQLGPTDFCAAVKIGKRRQYTKSYRSYKEAYHQARLMLYGTVCKQNPPTNIVGLWY